MEVSAAIGLSRTSVATYANAGYTYREKYKVTRSDGYRALEEIKEDWEETTEYIKQFPKQIRKIPIVPKKEG